MTHHNTGGHTFQPNPEAPKQDPAATSTHRAFTLYANKHINLGARMLRHPIRTTQITTKA